ncbi:DUF6879 family protein [Streptomyces sp. NPDC051658]|uniref:DUF6879 family protein n=1 Tax=Streptomyces sp. NPDC051658 TaxID=3365667 RepID=UPI003788C893
MTTGDAASGSLPRPAAPTGTSEIERVRIVDAPTTLGQLCLLDNAKRNTVIGEDIRNLRRAEAVRIGCPFLESRTAQLDLPSPRARRSAGPAGRSDRHGNRPRNGEGPSG